MHDARLYFNSMLPPLHQSSIGNQLKMQTEPFVRNQKASMWKSKFEAFDNLRKEAGNFEIEESDTDLENIRGSPYFKQKVQFADEVNDQ